MKRAPRHHFAAPGSVFKALVGVFVLFGGGCEGVPTIMHKPPGSAGTCSPSNIIATADIPNVYFVLDHSGSMVDFNKWPTMRAVLSQIIAELGASVRVGAAMFPVGGAGSCQPGREVLPLQLGDTQGILATAFLDATDVTPNGGTPTAATLRTLQPELSGFAGPTFVVLATDGGANCDPTLQCNIDTCTLNIDGVDQGCSPDTPPNCCDPSVGGDGSGCLDTAATVSAVSQLAMSGIPTYVVGIEGSAPYEQMLDQLAQAGNTARPSEPLYYRVDATDESALASTLEQVVANITSQCQVTLSTVPADISTLIVKEGGQAVPEDPAIGWSVSGQTLTLNGRSCDLLESGTALGLTVTEACTPPTP